MQAAVPLALILSSYVAASRVGGGGQQYVLAAHGIDPVLVPTVLFGRHPGKGPPGGAAVDEVVFESAAMAALQDVAGQYADAVITGYFASAEQVLAAARTIDALRTWQERASITGRLVVVVDPIMGDDDVGLYVPADVAAAIQSELVPRADWLTPNVWELRRLTGLTATDPAGVVAAAQRLAAPALVTSTPAGPGEIGVILVEGARAELYAHPRLQGVPRGTGDVITASLTAGLVHGGQVWSGRDGVGWAHRAVHVAADVAQASVDWRSPELPLVSMGARRLVIPKIDPGVVRMQELL